MRIFAAICASWLLILGATSTADAVTKPKPKNTNFQTGAHANEERTTESNRLKRKDEQISGGTKSRTSGKAEDVVWSVPPEVLGTRTRIVAE